MADDPTTTVEIARPLDELREKPDTIRDAIERAARIDVLTDWLSDLRNDVRNGYVEDTAQTIEQTTGGSFNVPAKGVGTAYRTQPQPTPTLADVDTFAEWYVRELLDDDPDREPTEQLVRFDDHVARRLVATCDSSALLYFVNHYADAPTTDRRSALARELADAVVVDVEWLVGGATLEAIVKGDLHAIDERHARVKVAAAALTCVDVATGEHVPGVVVKPARPGVLTLKAEPEFKRQLRGELDELLGPAALRE